MSPKTESREDAQRATSASDTERPAAPRRVASRDLFEGRKELVIDHDGREYRLRITQNGKLILTA